MEKDFRLRQNTLENSVPALLIVDDEPHVLEALTRSLHSLGLKIITKSCPLDAIAFLKSSPTEAIYIILSDYDMPKLRGHEFLEASREFAPDAIRVVLTGASDLTALQRFLKMGKVSRYLLKPWDNAELRSLIKECIELYSPTSSRGSSVIDSSGNSPDLLQPPAKQKGNAR